MPSTWWRGTACFSRSISMLLFLSQLSPRGLWVPSSGGWLVTGVPWWRAGRFHQRHTASTLTAQAGFAATAAQLHSLGAACVDEGGTSRTSHELVRLPRRRRTSSKYRGFRSCLPPLSMASASSPQARTIPARALRRNNAHMKQSFFLVGMSRTCAPHYLPTFLRHTSIPRWRYSIDARNNDARHLWAYRQRSVLTLVTGVPPPRVLRLQPLHVPLALL